MVHYMFFSNRDETHEIWYVIYLTWTHAYETHVRSHACDFIMKFSRASQTLQYSIFTLNHNRKNIVCNTCVYDFSYEYIATEKHLCVKSYFTHLLHNILYTLYTFTSKRCTIVSILTQYCFFSHRPRCTEPTGSEGARIQALARDERAGQRY